MKKLSYLIILALILGLVLTGCSLLSNISQVPATEQSGISYLTKGTETAPDVFTLYAGQNIEVGVVKVWNNTENLYVKYMVDDPWCLTETHLHIFFDNIDYTDVPQKNGNPIPGKFSYQCCYDEGAVPAQWVFQSKEGSIAGTECNAGGNTATTLTEILYTIPLNGWEVDTELFIAAHAEVIKYGTVCVDFEEYDEYDTVEIVSTLAGDVNFYMTDYSGMTDSLGLLSINVGDTVALLHTTDFFPVVAEEQTKDPDHDYVDLDMQNIVGFTVGGTYEDDWVKADPDSTGAGGKLLTDPPDFNLEPFWQHAYSNFQAILMDFTQINMPKSVSFAGVDLDWNEVWYILYFDMNNTLIHIATEGPPVDQSGDGVAFPISYSNPDIDKIVIWGNMNAGIPGKVGFAIDNICLEAVIQEETAWAVNGEGLDFLGSLPFSGNNWATYFIYNSETWTRSGEFTSQRYLPGLWEYDVSFTKTFGGDFSHGEIVLTDPDGIEIIAAVHDIKNNYQYWIQWDYDPNYAAVGTATYGTTYNGNFMFLIADEYIWMALSKEPFSPQPWDGEGVWSGADRDYDILSELGYYW